jgi:UDP-3-O-[3-hydroxymyristoyl] glucosamine N-acyltransferase
MKFNNRNVQIGKNVVLGENVKIGDNTIIYDKVVIGDNSIICENCVIGEPTNDYYNNNTYENKPTVIGEGSLIRSFTLIYAGCKIGKSFQTGHRVTIRENSSIGNNCSVGSYNDIQGFCIIGNYTRFQSFVNIGQHSEIGDYVFIYPYTVLTNDPTPPSNDLVGVKIGDYSQIASSTVLLPGCIIGKHSFVGANSTCGGQFVDDSFISGSPAKRYGNLSKMPLFNKAGKRHYPWPYHFERGMPWQGIGFEQWQNNNK